MLLLLLSLLLPVASAAQEDSAYRLNAYQDGPALGATLLTNFFLISKSESWIRQRCPCDPGEINALDRHVVGNANHFSDVTSDLTVGLAIGLPAIVDWIALGSSPELLEDLVVYSEVLSLNAALVNSAKSIAQRPRPRTYAGDPALIGSSEGYISFFSGHTSFTFASLTSAAVTLNLRHHSGLWPWVVAGAVGLSVAAERVAAGRHFYSDVAVGALVGASVGVGVPLFHRRAMNAAPVSTVHLEPLPDGGGQLLWILPI